MSAILAIATYVAYVFIVVMYTIKAVKYARLPMHLRWELYPIPKPKTFIGRFLYVLKDNFTLSEYFHRNKTYWLALYPWHVGFICVIGLHILCFAAAAAMLLGLPVSAETTNLLGLGIYYVILVMGVVSFVAGSLGSIGLIIKRSTDAEMRPYTSPVNYFNYLFTLAVFLSGLYAWYYVDPTFTEYREFWKGLIRFTPVDVEPAAAVHIILFALFLIYLPFTRSMHYITRFFAFFWIRWDERPNAPGGVIEARIKKLLDQPVGWSAPHIQRGKKWSEVATEPQNHENVRMEKWANPH